MKLNPTQGLFYSDHFVTKSYAIKQGVVHKQANLR